MADNKQVPVNTSDVIEAAEAKAAADKDTEQEEIENIRTDLERKLKSGNVLVDALSEHMKNPIPQIPTGFNVLDDALGDGFKDGGLPPGLITIGAIPSAGKTAIALQMADNIAERGERDVLLIALEMSAVELAARSVSRLTVRNISTDDLKRELTKNPRDMLALTARGVRLFNARRDKWKPRNQAETEYWQEMGERLQSSIAYYRERIAPRIHIYEPDAPIAASEIRKTVDQYAKLNGGKAPVVILDYIQILAPEGGNARNTEKQNMDAAALTLKHLSRDYKTPVICISSFNRMNYGEQVSMESFKESGGIEYSSDTVIGLQLYGTGMSFKKGETLDVDFEKSRNPRRIQARILKNRDGKTGEFINLEYYPAVNLFREVSTHPEQDAKKDVPAAWKANPPKMRVTKIEKKEDDEQGETEPAVPKRSAKDRPKGKAI